MKYKEKILDLLIDKFERSKTFNGTNSVNQKFKIKPVEIEPSYNEGSKYEIFINFNNDVNDLSVKGFINYKKQKNNVITSIELCIDKLDAVYVYLHRQPKKYVNERLSNLLQQYMKYNPVLVSYCEKQLQKIEKNQKVLYFDGDFIEYEKILIALVEVFKVDKEMFIRDFSVRVFGDSKIFEKIKSKVVSILFNFGDFPDEETILEELNIFKNPGHVYIKGAGSININGQIFDLSKFNSDIGVSSSLLPMIENINVHGDKVITIENLTTFNSFKDDDFFVVYLGGYHNALRRDFIKKIYAQNPSLKYFHYGDIDAGGFYILKHLRNKTGVDFKPYKMDIATLKTYMSLTKNLTENDRKRLTNLLNSEYNDVIEFMIINDCKLEQEALD